MKGQHRIVVANNRVHYEFTIRRNITILRGNSATGKTVLIELITQFANHGSDSGVTLVCDKPCRVLASDNWKQSLSIIKDSIVFIDENADFVSSHEFAGTIQKTDNYYVIVTREDLDSLPYSINEIYEIRESSRYAGLKQVYNEFHCIYKSQNKGLLKPDLIITEDSKTGYQFFSSIGIKCISAQGKSKIAKCICDRKDKCILVIADGAALGSDMTEISQKLKMHEEYTLYAPESFEWLLLSADILKHAKEISQVLEKPYEYIESQEYFSWERFFTHYLVEITARLEDTGEMKGYEYPKDKSLLPEAYKREAIVTKVLKEIKGVDFGLPKPKDTAGKTGVFDPEV